MRLDAHYGMLPERAFEKRGFGHTRPATLEGGGKGGGGGGQPTQSTVYNTNIPEYAKPYVTSMLGATARQLFTGEQKDDGSYDITGFRPYQPYSTDPTKYFAGPSGLQQQTYNEAARMQTPGQFGGASQLAGAAGMGQLGTAQQAGTLGGLGTALGAAGAMQAMPAFQAGQTYMQGVTDPSRVGQFMSPYQQQVTDIAKAAAVRDAQMMEQGNRLAAARQGTYGGARQALASLERERNLATNLANIQAQGSQQAYDRALQQMQFGSNLGLQGIQTGLQGVQAGMQGIGQGLQGVGAQQAGFAGAGQAAATLGGLGTQQQQADVARIGLQQQLGKAQQDYQQQIINQAVQDYATAQQYPLMQLGFMSNMLRGLPLQATTTQSYMAQPSLGQQALGLAGAYGAYKGMFKEGGEVKSYATGGIASSLEAKMEKMAKTDPKGLEKLIAQSNSKEVKEMGQEILTGIAAAPTGDLGRNLAGGGIVAFQEGGEAELSEEEKKYLEQNPYLQRSRAVKEALAPLGQLRNYDPVQKIAELGGMVRRGWEGFINESPEKQAERFRRASSRTEQAASPMAEVPVTKPAAERTALAGTTPATATPAAPVSVAETDREVARMKATAGANQRAREERVAQARGDTTETAATTTGRGEDASGIRGAMKEYMGLTGLDKPNAELQAYKDLIGQKALALGERSAEAGRMNKAMAFLEFASNPRGFGAGAVEGMKSYLKGEAANKREAEKIEMDFAKIRADLTRAEREEAKGNFEAAEKFYNNAQNRTIQRLQATKPGEFEKMYAVYSQNETAAGRTPTFQGFMQARTGTDETARLNAITKADTVLMNDTRPGGYVQLSSSKKPEDRAKAAEIRKTLIAEYMSTLSGTQMAGVTPGGGGKLQRNDKGELVYVQ